MQAEALVTLGLCSPYAQSGVRFIAHIPPLFVLTFSPGFILLIESVIVISTIVDIGLADNFPILSWPSV